MIAVPLPAASRAALFFSGGLVAGGAGFAKAKGSVQSLLISKEHHSLWRSGGSVAPGIHEKVELHLPAPQRRRRRHRHATLFN
jgi:hypothetical protein